MEDAPFRNNERDPKSVFVSLPIAYNIGIGYFSKFHTDIVFEF